jgi:chitinase
VPPGGTATVDTTAAPMVQLSFQVPSPPSISGAPPSPVAAGTPVDFSFSLGGTPAPSTTVTAGALPPGLGLSAGGRITGTPTTAGSYTAAVTAANGVLPAATTTFTIVVNPGPPAALVASAGSPQSTTATTPFATALRATVVDAYGNAVGTSGRAVTFTAPASGASATFAGGASSATVTTSSTGAATAPTLTANGSVGSYVVTASSPGLTSTTFSLSNTSLPVLTIGDVSVLEGDTGTRPMVFTVTLSKAITAPVTVAYTTVDGTAKGRGTAKAPPDFAETSGTLTIPAGQLTATITVIVSGDKAHELDETFTVVLSAPMHATFGDATAVGTILNDD